MPTLMAALSGDVPIIASGTVTLSMIVNLKRFVKRNGADVDHFEQIRGTEALERYLKALPARIQSPFVLDEDERALLEAAHQLRILRGYVLSHAFFPAYRLDEEAFLHMPDHLADNEVLVETFPLWDYQIALTRNGFAVVRMVRHFKDTPLSQIAMEIQQVQQAREADTLYAESRSSWRIAMDVTAMLVQTLGSCVELMDDHNNLVCIHFDPQMRKGRLPLHDRYLTIQLGDVQRGGQPISAEQLETEYASFVLGLMRLATVLRGGAAYDMRRRRPVKKGDLRNLSPWSNDLCIASNDAMLIYSQPATDQGPFADREDGYTRSDYWRGVARGAEWLVTLRTELQLVERQSTEMLATVSNLTARVHDGLLDEEDRRRLKALAEGVSRAFNLLPQLRYALVPSSISHATDAVYVFSHLQRQLGMDRIAEHVNTSMDELSSFLSYYSSTQLQFESRQREETESRTGLTISIMLILLSLVSVPSLIKDASEINWDAVLAEPPLQLASVIVLTILPIVLLIATTVYAVRRLNR